MSELKRQNAFIGRPFQEAVELKRKREIDNLDERCKELNHEIKKIKMIKEINRLEKVLEQLKSKVND